jgi:hypothetical protein
MIKRRCGFPREDELIAVGPLWVRKKRPPFSFKRTRPITLIKSKRAMVGAHRLELWTR